ncbi:hypothetical protein CRYUN_Cryun36dG0008500 [Craigia yunnanensis]
MKKLTTVDEFIELYEALVSKRLAKFIEKNQTCSQHPAKVLGTFRVHLEEPVVSLPSMPELGISDLPSFLCDNSGSYTGLCKLVKNQFSNFRKPIGSSATLMISWNMRLAPCK